MSTDLVTLAVDCGGTRLKAAVLDGSGTMVSERVRMRTPYPLSPNRFVTEVVALTAGLHSFDRITLGMPGMIRHGRVLATPHYPTKRGPFTRTDPELVASWTDFDAAAALEAAFDRPTLVFNDAEVHGFGVIEGSGLEMVVTLGTGLGSAAFDAGRLAPHIEWSHHPFRKGQTYDRQLGDRARRKIGPKAWNRRVLDAVETLRPVIRFDRLYVGGGNAKHVKLNLGDDVTLVAGDAGLTGGARAWDLGQEKQ